MFRFGNGSFGAPLKPLRFRNLRVVWILEGGRHAQSSIDFTLTGLQPDTLAIAAGYSAFSFERPHLAAFRTGGGKVTQYCLCEA